MLPRGNSQATLYVPPAPPYAASGRGAVITDAEGHQVIDCNNNYTSLIHGHAHPQVLAAAMAAMEGGSAFGLPTEAEIGLAEVLSRRFGRPLQWRFANSGSEAVMMAMRAAEQPEPIHWGGDELRRALCDAGVPVTGSGSLLRLFPADAGKAWWALYGAGVLVSSNGLMALSTAMTDEQMETVREAVVEVLG